MILYNMRERGPFEYDKFILNALQIHNGISLIRIADLEDNNGELIILQDKLSSMYNDIMQVSENIYLELLKYEE